MSATTATLCPVCPFSLSLLLQMDQLAAYLLRAFETRGPTARRCDRLTGRLADWLHGGSALNSLIDIAIQYLIITKSVSCSHSDTLTLADMLDIAPISAFLHGQSRRSSLSIEIFTPDRLACALL